MSEINYNQPGKNQGTKEQLANDLLVNPSHISNIENARSYPSLTALFTMSNSL